MAKRGPKPGGAGPKTPLAGVPTPPAYLDAEGKRHWKEVAALVKQAGLLSALDRDALTLYCTLWSRWRKAEFEVAKPKAEGGGEVITAVNGYLVPNPWYTIATATRKDLRPFLDMLGLSPKARAKLKLPEPEEVNSKWDEFED